MLQNENLSPCMVPLNIKMLVIGIKVDREMAVEVHWRVSVILP